jgi:hypothetical protein
MAYAIGTKFLVKSYELLDAGSVNIFNDEFEIEVANLQILFRFKKDRKREEGGFSVSRGTGTALNFDLFNYSSQIPQGCFEPLQIGSLDDDRKLYISFSVQTIKEKVMARVFTYNLYMDKKSNE